MTYGRYLMLWIFFYMNVIFLNVYTAWPLLHFDIFIVHVDILDRMYLKQKEKRYAALISAFSDFATTKLENIKQPSLRPHFNNVPRVLQAI